MANDTQTSTDDLVDGVLEGWHFNSYGTVSGHIYGDKKGRFMDGTYIYTSTVLARTDNIITTRNSTYQLGAAL